MKKIKAILFDLDGVLVDAKDWHFDAFNKALNNYGISIDHAEHLTVYDGLPTKKKMEILTVKKNLSPKLYPLIHQLKQQYTVSTIIERCKPQKIHRQALSNFKKQGYHMAVCSNSVRESVDLMLKHADLLSFIEFYISNEDVLSCKPDPEMYLTAMKRMGVLPQECLIVEDNHQGLKAAYDSGAHVLEVKSTNDTNYENIRKFILEIEGKKVECNK